MNLPMPWKTDDILNATLGDVVCGKGRDVFSNISIDSRNISDNNLFVAIIGERHDGHDFLLDVLAAGVSGCIIAEKKLNALPVSEWETRNITCIAVKDTTAALGDLARFQRRRSSASVIAITGSSGKTTTRRIVSSVMAQKFETVSTIGNFNNEIGLPLTLFQLSRHHEQAVVELGMNHFGEIKKLARIAEPDVGIITNIGPAHLEGVGSVDGVMKAKGELLPEIKKTGLAILNADDERILKLADQAATPVLFYGLSEKADVTARDIETNAAGTTFTLVLPEETISVRVSAPGTFMVLNALAAAAAGYHAGVSILEIKAGIEAFQPGRGRMNTIEKNGIHIIDDTYNANPDSMKSAIHTLLALKKKNRGFVVLGDMLELGDYADILHREIGERVSTSDITRLYITGSYSDAVKKGALDGNMATDNIITGTHAEILEHLKTDLTAGDWVLVKGSRGMKMETIIQGLINS